mmetsp:Transcript_5036/g.10398  ORF Transcript_5036/g.10398 Transcript_5036/m.10398 type:complete len:315 (+) Transcript_5036:160-1104(+)|eukprot:CAMPEP_0168741326 /NCGR_PEP_ID=MMETSP0724-20121128/12453_1 /TAXON_ID=265536 /ORGANISM="Amphiprora sp., Strain CCMP467" /LENGTH=314 /DNA_ID=CAMNT_0008788821 /DNA_START=110 /DNA_END=1054 /DNA_ORIENTATION=+
MGDDAKHSAAAKNDHDGEDEDSKIFPQRLMEILSDDQYADAICWLPHGRAFIIRNRQLFADSVMPKFFSRKAKYSSFTRKLNRWNFVRVSSGPELGAYYHEYFLRDKPHLAAQMFCKNARSKMAMADDTAVPAPETPAAQPPQQQQSQGSAPTQMKSVPKPIPTALPEKQPAFNGTAQPQVPTSTAPPAYQIPDFVLAALRKEGEAAISMTAAPTLGASNLQLLERQIQIMQEEHQRLLLQQMAARRLQEQQLQEQLQRQCTITGQQPQQQLQQQQPQGNRPNPEAIMRMKQLMELRARQRKGLAPTNHRASAA